MSDAPEYPDLVDVFYYPFLRPLGNLVILFARAEGALLNFVAAMLRRDEKDSEVQKFLGSKTDIEELAARADLQGYAQEELNEAIKGFFADKEPRNRLMHDEWFVAILDDDDGVKAVPMTRGLPRKKGSDIKWGEPKIQEIWGLAQRFREYRAIFRDAAHVVRERSGQQA